MATILIHILCFVQRESIQGNCLECEVKNAEINILRRRMQQLQEELEIALSSNGSKTQPSPSYEEKQAHVKVGCDQDYELLFVFIIMFICCGFYLCFS